MKKSLALLLILTATLAPAAEEADPAMAALKRMRDQLRSIMLQQQKTEAERAALAAEKVTLEEKVSTLDANLKKLAKESNLQKETDSKAIADLQDKAAKQAAEIVRLQESLSAWKEGHAEVVDAAKKLDAQRAEHAARAILAERKLADANRKNLDLYNIGNEILAKYEGFGLGTAITRESIDGLWRRLIDARRMDRAQLADLPEKRRSVLPGGLAVLEAVFSALKVESMSAAAGALREGVMLDLLGARRHEDVRALTVHSLEERFGVDRAQAGRVAETALIFFDAVARPWGLSPRHRGLLGWAARLHEVGVFLNHSSYHRHGAYVLKHADLPGFARQDQEALSALVLCQRGNASEARVRESYSGDALSMARLVALLRLSLRLHRSRSEAPLGTVGLSVRENLMLLAVPNAYLRAHPLTRAELQAEADQLPALGLTLTVAEV